MFQERAAALRHAPHLVQLPPLLGTAIIIAVLSGVVTPQVLHSGVAMATALVVGALLILIPPAVYGSWPDAVDEYYEAMDDRLRKLAGDSDGRPSPKKLAPPGDGSAT